MKSSLLAAAVSLFSAFTVCGAHAADPYELVLGPQSSVDKPLAIPLRKPAVFSYKTYDEIMAMRADAVNATKGLIKGKYLPTTQVFDSIVDKKPWWGTAGQAVFGPGMQSIIGPSEESRFVLNPYLFVGANSATVGIWNARALTQADLNNPDFPFFWMPESLVWEPRKKLATVSYDIHGYLDAISKSGKLKKPIMPNSFSLVAYNARDFGLEWIYLDTAASKNVVNEQPTEAPSYIKQYIHCGGSCGYPGGCNNMSPYSAEIDRLHLNKVPAQAVVKLWQNEPESAKTPPDMTFVLNFK